MCTLVGAFSLVLQDSTLSVLVVPNLPQSYFGVFVYPVSGGQVLYQYYVELRLYAWTEDGTGRTVPNQAPALAYGASNPTPNSLNLYWNFSAPYSYTRGLDVFTLHSTPYNVTIFNNTLLGSSGVKISSRVTNDSNVFNATTTKDLVFTLQTSHPILNYQISYTPTPIQWNFQVETQYYTAIFNQPTIADSDGVETTVQLSVVNKTYNTKGQHTGFTMLSKQQWKNSWYYDPEVSILLNPSSGGDGGSNTNLAYIALVALVLAPIVVVIVIGIGVAIFAWRRASIKRKLTGGSMSIRDKDNTIAVNDDGDGEA